MPPNIILIAIDTLRAHNVGAYGYGLKTSPCLDAHAAGGVRFSRTYPSAIPTQPSFTSLLTGTSPIVNNVVSHVLWKNAEAAAKVQSDNILPDATWTDRMPKITPEVKLVGELMQAGGFKTYAVDNLVKMRSHFERGWDEYVYSSEASGEDKRFAVTADDVNFHAFPLLERIKENPFFLFLHYWDPHAPYEPPAEYQHFMREAKSQDAMRRDLMINGRDLSWEDFIYISKVDKSRVSADTSMDVMAELMVELEARYDGEIAYVDNRLGRLFEHLGKLGLDKNTVVIVTSDHGESFGSHNTLGHSGLHETVTHIPLWFHGPGIPSGKVIDSLTRQVDIVPTILDLGQVRSEIPYEFSGKSLVPLMEGTANSVTDVVSCAECSRQKTRSIHWDKWKFIRSLQDHGHRVDRMPDRELYDLEADPLETCNLIDRHPDVAEEMEEKLASYIQEECRKVGRAEDVVLTTPLTSDLSAYDDPSKFAFQLSPVR